MVIRNKGFEAEFDDEAKQLDLSGQLKFLEDAKSEIDNFGPSQVVTGDGVDGQSGRAIQLRQNAALAELGPFILSYRAWKLRVYRKMFAAIQEHWTSERWIRVTDDDGLAQFIGINRTKDENGQPVVDANGNPAIMNALGSVDVDIILDEGPDTLNAAADTTEVLRLLYPTDLRKTAGSRPVISSEYQEPPYWYYPVNQSLGAALYLAGRHEEASQAFRAALTQAPNNGWVLYGLAKSEAAQGRRQGIGER